jgi:uncharacterized Fe-S cluster-containing radical SAM superfamily protein
MMDYLLVGRRMFMAKYLDTEAMSVRLRRKALDVHGKRLLITNFYGTEQEEDLTELPNCNGFGRIRHFRRLTSLEWPSNPLPIDPACRALGLPLLDMVRAQVFQNAICNWRCWYCFVPFDLLSANSKHSSWLGPSEIMDLYLAQPDPPPIIDLTGGQPDLTPEWVPWMMRELQLRKLDKEVYLWSDDNLSNDFFWRFLSDEDLELIATYEKYGRVCCFKGFNQESFSFNTQAEPELFGNQFELMSRLLTLNLDIYAYATFTSPNPHNISDDIARFVDRLQVLNEYLPLRTVPLEIQLFRPVLDRMTVKKDEALKHQWIAIEAWQKELQDRYSATERAQLICDVPLRGRL